MQVNVLADSEENLWMQCGTDAMTPQERQQFICSRRSGRKDPRCFIVATEQGRCIGKLKGSWVHQSLYHIDEIMITEAAAFSDVGTALLQFVLKTIGHGTVETSVWKASEPAELAHLLQQNDFMPYIDKGVCAT